MNIRLRIASVMLTLIMIMNLLCSCTADGTNIPGGTNTGTPDTGVGEGTGNGGTDIGDGSGSGGESGGNTGSENAGSGEGSGGGTGGESGDEDYDLTVDLAVSDSIELAIGESVNIELSTHGVGHAHTWRTTSSSVTVTDGVAFAADEGCAVITLVCEEECDSLFVQVTRDGVAVGSKDPYREVTKSEFYKDYIPASSRAESVCRTLAGLMSGEIGIQDQAPTVSSVRPTAVNGSYIKNSVMLYSDNGLGYCLTDSSGEVVEIIYKGGGYVMLEEVAAHIFAFGTLPANYVSSKNARPTESIWGEYLRLNHSKFSGSTTKYPYEPVLPRISGCGGDLQYYELDIGTTGTDCDPSYPSRLYNNGTSITRGAARIVYSRTKVSGAALGGINDKYLFYTYNHYNDFCEYLNYYGGWGETFGNITGGGSISSKTDYNPTPYVPVVLGEIWEEGEEAAFIVRKKLYAECA